MAVACASRFACLKIEDLEVDEQEHNQPSLDKSKDSKGTAKTAKGVQVNNSKSKKKKKNAVEAAELQSLVFGTNASCKPKTAVQNAVNPQKKKSRNQVNDTQWQEWKAKDDKFVATAFEQDLQQALFMSKIDFEEKKTIVRQDIESEGQSEAKKKKKGGQKKEKQTTMTLDVFQNLLPSQIENALADKTSQDDTQETEKKEPEPDFFERIEADTEKILAKEQRMEAFKNHQVGEQALSLQYREELQQKNKTIDELQIEIQQLKEELKGAKYRNKKLCHILSHGEIRDKAEILLQVDQLTNVRDELTEEVRQLHVALEQERSKVHTLQMELKKQGYKKDKSSS